MAVGTVLVTVVTRGEDMIGGPLVTTVTSTVPTAIKGELETHSLRDLYPASRVKAQDWAALSLPLPVCLLATTGQPRRERLRYRLR
jgi:hypothetical protein